MFTRVKNRQELDAMRDGGKMLATVLQLLKKNLEPGMTTKDLSHLAEKELKQLGGAPSVLGYQGYPDVICISVNDEVVHGIPSDMRVIQDGDIVSLDFCVTYKNLVTDSAISVIAGKPLSQKDANLVRDTEKALYVGINAVHDGVRTGDIGSQIEHDLNRGGYGIVRDLVGHGVGDSVHEDPNVPNYGKKGSGPKLTNGMTIAIEPMATLGTERVYVGSDGWTVLTWDKSRAAHFEHTVAITEDGAEILTAL
ncbi:MAG TPA: type I methionyl aminopeptidase [Candidatus Saccharimonadales bacterium]|nr:type I methionyl aminopeptidase [Candidatus Saccharimonadales bacterium]